MFEFTTKIRKVSRRGDGELVGCALLCQAPENALVAVQGIAEHPRAREVLEALLDEYGKRAVFGE